MDGNGTENGQRLNNGIKELSLLREYATLISDGGGRN